MNNYICIYYYVVYSNINNSEYSEHNNSVIQNSNKFNNDVEKHGKIINVLCLIIFKLICCN